MDVDWKDGEVFATCSSDRSIQICDVSSEDTNVAMRTLNGHEDEVNAVCWSPGYYFFRIVSVYQEYQEYHISFHSSLLVLIVQSTFLLLVYTSLLVQFTKLQVIIYETYEHY